ncbi:MAG: patatin-like phospholipase family protein [Sphaerochaetaceae bacterium]|nr:patatin-like phospholipase family protein [Sphaerochaetaceae bacterium]
MNLPNILRPKNKKLKDRYILCLDGGGMRGIIPVVILKKFYSMLSGKEEKTNYPITSYFDLISGTSTGGLIATALTCGTGMKQSQTGHGDQTDLQGLIDIYKADGKTIFPQELFTNLLNPISDKYPVQPIENLLKTWFEDTPFHEAKIPTLVMSYNASLGLPFEMTSTENKELLAWEVARSTSAAPTYFSPYKIGKNLLIDGGVIANNPSLYAYKYAKRLYPECQNFHILSLSTCTIPYTFKKKSSYGLSSWLSVHKIYSTSQMQTVEEIITCFEDCDYLRIDKPLSKSIPMDNSQHHNMIMLEKHGEKLYNNSEEKLKTYCNGLIKNRKIKER